MTIRKRIVKNKRNANGLPSGKSGVVYDVFLKFKDADKFRSYCRRGFLTMANAVEHEKFMRSKFIERAKKKDGYQCLDEYLNQWLANGQAADRWRLNTYAGYEINIRKHILPVCGHYLLKEITPEVCDRILLRMKFLGLSDASTRYVRQTLSAALNDACAYGYIPANPVYYTITRLKQTDFAPVLYDLKDMAHLMNSVYDGAWECIFLLTGLYGLRRSEALGLKWSHIDFHKREILIDQQLSSKLVRKKTGEYASGLKTRGSKRTLYLSDYSMDILLRQMRRLQEAKEKATNKHPFHDHDYVLFREDGSPYDETHLGRQFHLLTDRINLPRCRIHDLRHSTASNIYYLTSDYLVVAKILGHTIQGLSKTLGGTKVYESTTSLYIHVHPDKEKAAVITYHEAIEYEQFQQKQNQKVIIGYNFR